MKNLKVFKTEEEADLFAKDNNGFVKKRSYEVNGSGKKELQTFWYVYERTKKKDFKVEKDETNEPI